MNRFYKISLIGAWVAFIGNKSILTGLVMILVGIYGVILAIENYKKEKEDNA